MNIFILMLLLLPMRLWAQAGYVDQNLEAPLEVKGGVLYAFDSNFVKVTSKSDLNLKIRISYFEQFIFEGKKLSGEMIKSKGNFQFQNVNLSRLRLEDLKGDLSMTGGKIEYSELSQIKLNSVLLKNIWVQNTVLNHFSATSSEFHDVVFSETDFLGVSLPKLRAHRVKFLGRTAAINLRGCVLKDVEFNFERIDYIAFNDCHLENVYVNGKLVRDSGILKGE